MKGKHIVTVRNRRVQFTLELERNITVIRGDSATGKTTLVGMLRDYEAQGEQSGVSLTCDRRCGVLTDRDWEQRLPLFQDSILFVDEGNAFVSSEGFAKAIRGSSNYYVLITRENLHQLPYSVDAILELRVTTSRMRRTYSKTYPYYKVLPFPVEELARMTRILTEDKKSGFQMFDHIGHLYGTQCESARGKSSIFATLQENHQGRTLVVADGAAFGADMENVYQLMQLYPGHIVLYLPESFEWLILKAGVIPGADIDNILKNPADYIESAQYFSWEQYFTELLIRLSSVRDYMRYSKEKLLPFYLQEENVQKILHAMGEKE
jgi:hypothetical protein